MEGAIRAGNGWIGRSTVLEVVIVLNKVMANCHYPNDLIVLQTRQKSKRDTYVVNRTPS